MQQQCGFHLLHKFPPLGHVQTKLRPVLSWSLRLQCHRKAVKTGMTFSYTFGKKSRLVKGWERERKRDRKAKLIHAEASDPLWITKFKKKKKKKEGKERKKKREKKERLHNFIWSPSLFYSLKCLIYALIFWIFKTMMLLLFTLPYPPNYVLVLDENNCFIEILVLWYIRTT